MTIDETYLRTLKQQLLGYDAMRREVIKQSGDAQHHAKRAIFALQRHDMQEAKAKLDAAKKELQSLQRMVKKEKRVAQEGSYREAVEEFVEAVLFHQFVSHKKISSIAGIDIDPEVYIAGLCDVPGEMYRYAIKAATEKDTKTVMRCMQTAEDIVGELIEYNLTKYLRTKFDQAKQAVSKLEIVVYELSLREGNGQTHGSAIK